MRTLLNADLTRGFKSLAPFAATLVLGCSGGDGASPNANPTDAGSLTTPPPTMPAPDPAMPTPTHPPITPVTVTPVTSADRLGARRVRRLTAEQWNASLTVATGQAWTDWEENAEVLGRPDFTMTTEEGEQMSVIFEQLILEAARQTCGNAVDADRADGTQVLLGDVDLSAPVEQDRSANLQRLLLRFHGHEITAADDTRLSPWRSILDAPMEPADLGTRNATAADVEAARWEAICIGLATHPDFLTY